MSRVKFVTESRGNLKEVPQLLSSPLPSNVCIVITILHYLKPIARTIKQSEPLDNVGTDNERTSFMALKNILTVLESGKNEPINIYPFLEKFCHIANTNLHEFEHLDVSFVWDSVIKLVALVIPPIREIFMGKILNNYDITNWLNSISRCFHAQFVYPVQNLEEIIDSALIGNEVIDDDDEDKLNDEEDTLKSPATFKKVPRIDKIRRVNAKLIHRAPEVLVFSIESPHLPSALRFTDSSHKSKSSKAPVAIRFPASFDVSTIINSSIERRAMLSMRSGIPQEYRRIHTPCLYDLSAVVSLEGIAYDSMRAFYRCLELEDSKQWFEGSTPHHEEVETCKAVDGNFLISSDSRRIHPRLLVYTKRGMFSVLERLGPRVSKAGQMKELGDTMYDTAETPEHYDDARHYYEQAIGYDESLRSALHDRMSALEAIERNQRAQCYESQADISLGKRRFKEACDLYKNALRSVAANSPAHHRLREKEDYMMKIISLEISNHLTEKGQECLKSKAYAQGKEHFSQALKLNPSYIHLQTIIAGIEEAITIQSSAQKVSDANQAMKVGKYKQANQLYLEAIALVPSRQDSLQPVLESLVVLMQGEEALSKQRAGLVALEDKKYSLAIECISEAIELLPAESATEHAFFLCDRAQVYFELKEFHTSIRDCNSALELRSDFAIAYLRLGAAQFELEQYDEATMSYERALRHDASLTDQVKVKVRQVNTAKEVLQRKEREAERLRDKEEQKRLLEERRAKEEAAKKSREQKLQQEKAEKAERMRMAEEEKKTRAALIVLKDSDEVDDKVAAKERLKKAKAENNVQKAQEREKAKLEKERERERLKVERERKIQSEQRLKEDEIKKQKEFAAEIERAQMRQKEAEREKELERERARIERERVIAERERMRVEKISSEGGVGRKVKASVPLAPKSADNDPGTSKVKSSAAGPAPTTSSSSTVDALPANGVKWSSFLTQPPLSPTASSFQHSKKQTIATSSSAVAVTVSGIKASISSVVPDSMQDFPPLVEMAVDRDFTAANASSNVSGKNYQNDAGYQQYVSSSAWGWADHERAVLEATAERISVNKSTNEPSVATVMSSSSAGDSPTNSSSSSSSIQSPSLSSSSFFAPTKVSMPPGIDSTNTISSSTNTISSSTNTISSSTNTVPSSTNPRDLDSSSEISPLLAKLGLGSSYSSSGQRGNYVSNNNNNNNGDEQISTSTYNNKTDNNNNDNNNNQLKSSPSLDAEDNYDISLLLLTSSLNSNDRKANKSSFNSFNLDALTTTPLGDLASSSHLNHQLDFTSFSSGSSLNKDFGLSYGLSSSDKSLALSLSESSSSSSESSSHLSALLGSMQSSTKKDSQAAAASTGLSYGTAGALSSSSSYLFPSSSSMADLNGKKNIFSSGLQAGAPPPVLLSSDAMDDFFDLLGQKGSSNLNNALLESINSGKSTALSNAAVSSNISGLSFSSSSGYNSLRNGQSDNLLTDNLLRGGQSDNLLRGQSDNLLRSGQSDNLLRGIQSDNLLRGQSDNLLRSGQSDNLLRGIQSDNLLRGQSDNLLRSGQSDNLLRGIQSDNLLRGQSDNLLRSGQSDNLLRGQSDNLFRSGQSDNLLRSGQSDNLLRGQSDNFLRGGQSDNLLRGIQSDNLLRGQSDLLRGQSDNLFRSGQSDNLLRGQSDKLLRGQSDTLLRNGHYDGDPASLSLQPLLNFNPSSLHSNSFFPVGSSSSSSAAAVPEPLSYSPFHKATSGSALFSNLSFSDHHQQQQQRVSHPAPFLDLPNVPPIGSGSLSSKVNQSSINTVGNNSNGSHFHSHYDRAGMVIPSSPPPLTKMTSYPTSQFGSLVAHNEVASSSGSNKGIDQDVVLGNEFPMVAWLRQYNMHMYRWAGNSTEWTEFAMHVPRALTPALFNDDNSPKAAVSEIMRRSGCRIWMERERLGGHQERFIVFHKGSDGKATHVAMLTALELLSGVMRHWILYYGQVYRIASRGTPLYESSGSAGSTASMASEIVSLTLSAEIISAVTLFVSGIARRDRPPLLRVSPIPGSGYLQRYLEVSKDVAALLSGQSGRKLKDLALESGAKIQFRVSRVSERDGRSSSILEVHGAQENVDRALYLIWDVLQMLGRDYTEVLQ